MSVLAIPTPTTVDGLPFHPLIVHFVVVLLPLAIIGAVGISIWPAMRRHLGLLTLLVAVVGLVLVPVATSSGEKLRDELGAAQLVRQHQDYAEKLLPLMVGLTLLVLFTMIADLARRLGPVMEAAADSDDPMAVQPEPLDGDPLAGGSGGGGVALAVRPQVVRVPQTTTRLDRSLGRLIPASLRTNAALLRAVTPVLAVLTVAVALVLAWYVYKTGDSGAKAVWGGR
jgi:uncharacterized membrane protein